MKYVQPFGEADPNAPYKDRNTGAGQAGSKVPAKAIENPQREIQEVILQAGLEPSSENVTQLNEAIDLKIALATGGGANPLDDLLNLLRARLRIFPEILTADGRFNLTVPSTGNVRIPAGVQVLHRGVFTITTAEQTFPTAANKTYHMRYRFTGTPGWSLVDLADGGYNPGGALAETNTAFDTAYDDMISHKVVTDASNVATIIPLANKDRLFLSSRVTGAITDQGSGIRRLEGSASINWARTPSLRSIAGNVKSSSPSPGGALDGYAGFLESSTVTRYAASAIVQTDWATGTTLNEMSGYLDFNLSA